MIDQIIQWLREGGEQSAAAVLSECALDLLFVDLLFEFGGGREFELYDVNIAAPRKVIDSLDGPLKEEGEQIEKAIRALAQIYNWHIRDIVWVPKPSAVKSLIEQEISAQLSTVDSEHVQRAWEKALKREREDPEGAITAARTLIETVCKHILDEERIDYPGNADLPKLYYLTAAHLNLAPTQYTEKIIRKVLGNCQSIVDSIAALRNELGDAHGRDTSAVMPSPFLAELAVNLAGAMAKYLVAVWELSKGE